MYSIVEWPDGRESQNEGWLHYTKQMRSMHIGSRWDLQLATAARRNQSKAAVKAKLTGNPFEVEQVLESSQSPQVVLLTGTQEQHMTTCYTALLSTSNYNLTRRDQQIA